MPIRQLDPHMAELIAAGEVVERPASVVKELVENAIDAGADSIKVEIERGGISLIRVQDDGCGVRSSEIPLMFSPHATSKLERVEDLDAISTLGFRGEALASVASVAQVELLTKWDREEDASLYRIAGGKPENQETAARPSGTTIAVRNLFYNTPARMKFLKKDSSEGTFVTEVMTRLALSHPEISFRFVRDGKEVFATPGDDNLKTAAYTVLGAAFARDLIDVDETDTLPYRVRGLTTQPHAARASRSMQFFYINRRFVKNRTMMAALEQAYRGTTMVGKFPGAVLFLDMPPDMVDVNVHPAKTEVRFAREKDVFSVVYTALKKAVTGSFNKHASLELNKREDLQAMPEQADGPEVQPKAPAEPRPSKPEVREVKAYNQMLGTLASESTCTPYTTRLTPPMQASATSARPLANERALDIEPEELSARVPVQDEGPVIPPPVQVSLVEEPAGEPLRLVGEVFRTYILAQRGDTLVVIDKHAAHERIIYEELVEKRQNPDVQQLLIPVTVKMSALEKEALLGNVDALSQAGFDLEDFGDVDIMVRGIPADIDASDVEGLIVDVAGRIGKGQKGAASDRSEWVMHSIACRAAIKAGDKTPPEQLLRLAGNILDGTIPPYCPHGRPVVLSITRKELEKQFGRLG